MLYSSPRLPSLPILSPASGKLPEKSVYASTSSYQIAWIRFSREEPAFMAISAYLLFREYVGDPEPRVAAVRVLPGATHAAIRAIRERFSRSLFAAHSRQTHSSAAADWLQD